MNGNQASGHHLRPGWFEALLDDTAFLSRHPDYAGILARMDVVPTNTVPVMAVGLGQLDDPSSRLRLFVNPDYFEENPQFRSGVLRHEINHVLLGHLTNRNLHAVAHPKVMELAMEISANEYIRDPLPGEVISLEKFTQYGVAPGQSTLERYRLLATAHENGELDLDDWWSSGMVDSHRPQKDQAGANGLGDALDARSDGATDRNWNREESGWGKGGPASEKILREMKEAIARHLGGWRGGPDDPGGQSPRRPKELQRALFDGSARPRMDWERILREVFPRRREIFPDYLRPNRRFQDRVGEVPGRRRRPPKPRLLAAIDTSGSMRGEILDRIRREIRELSRHAVLTIAECDAAVHRIYPAAGAPLHAFTGGGDTDFAPVFAEAGRTACEGIIYFTDGKGSLRGLPGQLPLLWVLSNEDPFFPEHGAILRM